MYYVREQMVYKCERISQGAVENVCALCAIAVIIHDDMRLLFISVAWRGQMRPPPVRQTKGTRPREWSGPCNTYSHAV